MNFDFNVNPYISNPAAEKLSPKRLGRAGQIAFALFAALVVCLCLSVPALGGAEPVMPGIGQRMDRSGALPQGFCRISRFSHITPDGRHVGHAAVHRWVGDCDGGNADIFRMVSG